MLTLSEELYLALQFDDKEACLAPLDPNTAHLIVAGGVAAELFLAGRLRLDENQVTAVDTTPTGDDLLDHALSRLQPNAPFQSSDGEWFNAVAQKLLFADQMLSRLLAKGIIQPLEKRKWFGLSRAVVYPLQDASIPQRWQQLQMDVLVNGRQPTASDAVLLFMTTAWGTPLPASLSRQEQKTADARWQALFGDYWGAYPVEEAGAPIPGLDPAARQAIGHMTVSWATLQAFFVAQEITAQAETIS
jgi:hypothetical protein